MFELFAAAFLLDFWLLAFLGLCLVTLIFSSELGSIALTLSILIISVAGLVWLFHVPIISIILDNPFMLLVYALIYLAIGAIYTALWAWPEYIRDNKDKIDSRFGDYKSITEDNNFESFLLSVYYPYKASHFKELLSNWVIAWPFDLVWELARKPIQYLYRNIYTLLGTVFEKISLRVARKIHNKS